MLLVAKRIQNFFNNLQDFVKPYFTYINKNHTKLHLQTEAIPCTNGFGGEGQWLFYDRYLQYK